MKRPNRFRTVSLVLAAIAAACPTAVNATPSSNAATDGNAPRISGNGPINERFIQVENSDVVLRLWDQTVPGGALSPFYSISLDGRSYSRPRQTDYLIKLRYAYFDPALGIPSVAPLLQAQDDSELYIVQFVTQPVEAMREALRNRGATIQTFLANHAHIATMTPAVRDAVEQLGFVRWVGRVHPAYKLDEQIQDQLLADEAVEARRYSILLFESGEAAQSRVSDQITADGGLVTHAEAAGHRLEATMTLAQVLDTARLDDVMFIDPKGDIETDMDIARMIGGADFIEDVAGFNGAGVRGEVADTGVFLGHPDFQATPPIIHTQNGASFGHGTSVYGIVFGDGTGNARARGMLPGGQGIFTDATPLRGGGPFRFQHTAELVDPFGPFRAVFQTNSTGDPRTFFYTTISAEMDDLLFANDITICQSQSNAGNQDSRPQAWAKNIVSAGGVRHQDTLTRSDDRWGSGASTGPASDGRVKPTLTHFYDSIFTTSSNGSYTNFGGTSGATPIIAGHFGLMFQMWHEGVFEGVGRAPTVFDSRPHMSTAKALLVNTAFRYDWNAGGPNGDLNRFRQGWGMPDLRELYESADRFFVVDEGDVLGELASSEHTIHVAAGEPMLRVTMVYADPMGVPMSNQHRINDLSLRVTSPSGLQYWGNHGLANGNLSTPGGNSNVIDTVENVFIANPSAGDWRVEVFADEINQDSHVETPELDADYALVVTGGQGPQRPFAFAVIEAPVGQSPANTRPHVEVRITSLAESVLPNSPMLHYRFDGGAFSSIPMTDLGSDAYGADLPTLACGDLPEYFIDATGDGGSVLDFPADAPSRTFAFLVGENRVVFADDFELDRGWTTRILNGATGGAWERGVPVNDPDWPNDPISDSDGSGQCWLTENALGDTDVDDGRVRLISPAIDMSQGEVTIHYDYFLRLDVANGADEMLVEMNDRTAPPNWIRIARHISDGGLEWRTQTLTDQQLRDAGVTLSSEMKIRFTVRDGSPQSIVEAGLDAFGVTVRGCFPNFGSGDVNCDGEVNAFDIEPFLLALFDPGEYSNQFPDCDINLADVNNDGQINAFDIEPFLGLLFP